MRCESWFKAYLEEPIYPVVRCDREFGHRPQTWHRSTHPDGGTVRWAFTNEERAEWKRKYGVSS